MQLNVKGFALATGAVWELALFVVTLITAGRGFGATLGHLAGIFAGYEVTYLGSLVGLVYGLVSGLLLGALFAVIVGCFLSKTDYVWATQKASYRAS